MAAVDPIDYAQLCKLFPALTDLQLTDTCLYSSGATYKEIGELRGVSPETIKKSLESAQKRLKVSNLQSLRAVFLTRITVSQKFDLSSNVGGFSFNNSEPERTQLAIQSFIPFVRELSPEQVAVVWCFCIGLDVEQISYFVDTSEDNINLLMDQSLSKLGVANLHSLRHLVLSRVLISLTLVSSDGDIH